MTIANKNSKSRLTAILCGFFVLAALSVARAADIYWINPDGGDFSTASNWDPEQVPGLEDKAIFDLDATYTVTWSETVTNQNFYVGAGNVTWDLQGNTYAYSNSPANVFEGGCFVVIKNGECRQYDSSWGGFSKIRGAGTVVKFTPPVYFHISECNVEEGATLILDGDGAEFNCQDRGLSGTIIVTNGGFYNGRSQLHAQPGSTIWITGENSRMRTDSGTSFQCGPDGGFFISNGGSYYCYNTAGFYTTNGTHIVLDNGSIGIRTDRNMRNYQSVIEGHGWITGNVFNAGGWIRPGGSNSVGDLFLTGIFSNQYEDTGGTIEIELAGAGGEENDQFLVDGAFHAAGTLDIKLINGFEPAHKDIFNILDFTSITGEFDDINLPHDPENWDLSKLYTDGEIRFIRPPGIIFSVR